ncbi:MAG TPA: hypothetical protein VJ023_15260 [Pyrinomonadaceae bacterium]|nr:hypothetical protein [Pyrinomonadaceae bacterium]
MPFKTYIIRFPSEKARNEFQRALKDTSNIQPSQVEFGEFLPDVIVRDISDQTLKEIKRIADPGTRFIEDFQHDLFRP